MRQSEGSVTKEGLKSDEQVVAAALQIFKFEDRLVVQDIHFANGSLSFGEAHLFTNLNDLSQWIWNLPDTGMYIAVLTRSGRHEPPGIGG